MIDNTSEFLWRAFASTGDPMAYLNFKHSRRDGTESGFEGRNNENNQDTGIGS
jgi:hypothetical protein